jgi:hypothetical protein
MAPLTAARRGSLALSNFAVPAGESKTGKPAYPIDTAARARSALARVDANGSSAEQRKVKLAVKRKYPGMKVQ